MSVESGSVTSVHRREPEELDGKGWIFIRDGAEEAAAVLFYSSACLW